MRYLMFIQAAENQPLAPALMEAMGPYIENNIKRGVLVDTGGLAPTSKSARVKLYGGKINVMDGPFTESKEVIGGYAIIEAPSYEAAMKEAVDFMELHRKHAPGWEGTCEVRPFDFLLSDQG